MKLARDQLVDLARRHAALEANPDLTNGFEPAIEAVLATLNEDPVYELLPAGQSFRGCDAARRYYEHFFKTFRPMVVGGDFVSEYVGKGGVCLEHEIVVRPPDGEPERHRVISVLVFGDAALSGERVYASDRFLSLLFGPMWK